VSDWFLDLFTAEAEKLISKPLQAAHGLQGVDTSWWVGGLPEPAEEDVVVGAVDGGGGIQPLAGGGALYIARAFGVTGPVQEEPERGLELRLYPVRDSRILDALRSWVEHRVASSLAMRLRRIGGSGSILLMDGSYRALVSAALVSIAKASRGRLESLSHAYLALLSLELIVSVKELFTQASRAGILLAYVSKDHSYSFLKEYVLLSHVASKAPETMKRINDSLQWYPLKSRHELLELSRSLDEELRQALLAALDQSYRDTAFIWDMVGGEPGYTHLLTIPPSHRLHSFYTSRGGVRRVVETLCSSIERILPGEEAEACWGDVDRAVEAIDSLPGVGAMYVRLQAMEQPLLVETPAGHGFWAPGRRMLLPDVEAEKLIAVLYRDYGGEDYYNIYLVAAHVNATLTGRQMEAYMRLLDVLASAHGVRLMLARRSTMHRGLRGRRRRRIPGAR